MTDKKDSTHPTTQEQEEEIEDPEDNEESGDESDDSDEEAQDDNEEIRLGFIDDEPQELELLSLNEGFPNKVGGKPV